MIKKISYLLSAFLLYTVILAKQNKSFPVEQKSLYNNLNVYFNTHNLENVYTFLFRMNPDFFVENPSNYFPIAEQTEENIINFINMLEPLNDFFTQQQWGETGLPFSVEDYRNNIINMFNTPKQSDQTTLQSSDVIYIPGATFPTMLSRFLYAKNISGDLDIPIFFGIRKERENTKLFYENVKNIIETIESKLKRNLTSDEIEFIHTHNNNEYDFVKIIQEFFDDEVISNIFFVSPEEDKYAKCRSFVRYLKSLDSEVSQICIVSHNIFAFYDQYIWQKALKNEPTSIIPLVIGFDLPLNDPKNPEGVLSRNIRMSTLLLNMMKQDY